MLTILASTLLSPALLAPAPQISADVLPAGRAHLNLGPLRGGEPLRIDLRSNRPLGNALLLFGLTPAPTPLAPLGLAAPAVHLPAGGAPLVLPLDATGRLRLELPTIPGQYAGLEGLPFFIQAGVPQPDGSLAVSALEGVRFEAQDPGADFLSDVAPTLLPPQAVGLNAGEMVVGDVSGDGLDDLVLDAGGLQVWTGTPAGGFSPSTLSIPHPGDTVGELALGDLDGDGDFDLLVGGGYDDFSSIPDRLFLNDGAGGFSESPMPTLTGLCNDIELLDYDLDGDLDVAFARGGEPHLSLGGAKDALLINDGSANFTVDPLFESASWNTLVEDTNSVTAADYDGDGDLDLLLGRSDFAGIVGPPGAPNRMLTNLGGVFIDEADQRLFPLFDDNTNGAAFADLDGDGDLDLVVANSSLSVPTASSGELYLNQGGAQGGIEGVFVEAPGSAFEDATDSGLKLGVTTGDLDADGDIDVGFAVHDLGGGSTQPLYLNQGGAQGGTEGQFVYASWFDPGDFISGEMFLIDADRDGDLDVLQAGGGDLFGFDPTSSDLKFYLNVAQ